MHIKKWLESSNIENRKLKCNGTTAHVHCTTSYIKSIWIVARMSPDKMITARPDFKQYMKCKFGPGQDKLQITLLFL